MSNTDSITSKWRTYQILIFFKFFILVNLSLQLFIYLLINIKLITKHYIKYKSSEKFDNLLEVLLQFYINDHK